jgi:hypothetical protein
MRLSLSSLFVVLGYCAVFCVALLNAGPAAVMVLRSIALVSLLFGLLAIWYRRAERRAYWVGYLHGGGTYAILTFYALGGVSNKPVWTDEQIISGEFAKLTYQWLPESKRGVSLTQRQNVIKLTGATGYRLSQVVTPNIVPSPNFRYLFHSAFIVFFGWLGGLVGVWAFRTRDVLTKAIVLKSDEHRVTKETLLGIVKAATVTTADLRAKSAAVGRLAMFLDSVDVVAVLLDEIAFRPERTNKASAPLDNYPAAQVLAMGGSTVRSALLSVPLDRLLSDKDVALRAHILVAIDGGVEIAAYRLRQMLEQSESSNGKRNGEFASITSSAPGHGKVSMNLGRILAYIEDPTFFPRRPVFDPLQEM